MDFDIFADVSEIDVKKSIKLQLLEALERIIDILSTIFESMSSYGKVLIT